MSFLRSHGLLDGFAFLALDVFAGVADTLALVRLGRIVGADVGGDLADQLAVDAFDLDLGVFRDGDLDALRDREMDVVREAEVQVEDGCP